MSWNGSHPVITKAQAKAILPARACKLCVYWVRCQIDQAHLWRRGKCPYCGSTIDLKELQQKYRLPRKDTEEPIFLERTLSKEEVRREVIISKLNLFR